MSEKLKYLLTLLMGALAALALYIYYTNEIKHKKHDLIDKVHTEALEQVNSINHKMMMFYQGLRTIARMPGIREIQDHVDSMGARTAWSIQELYNNLASNIEVSEVYIIPLDFNPDVVDKYSGVSFKPLLEFDSHIVGRSASSEVEGAEEIEIYEYRSIAEDLDWMKANAPVWIDANRLDYPAVFSNEVITCDNRYYSTENPSDQDRSGLVYSIPFYDMKGRLNGLVTGTILTHVLRNMLSSGHHVIRNHAIDFTVTPSDPGPWRSSGRFVSEGTPDPGLIYSVVFPLDVDDEKGDWELWVGVANVEFWGQTDIKELQQFIALNCAGLFIIIFGLLAYFRYQEQASQLLKEKNTELEHEIEDRQKSQLELKEQEVKFHVVFNSVLDGIITTDESGIINACNPTAQKIFGYKRDELIGMNVNRLMPVPERIGHDQYMEAYKVTGKANRAGTKDRRLTGVRKDNSTFPLEISINSTVSGGQRLIVGIMRDVTERVTAENNIKHARDKALESSKLKSELLANVSHELRTPLNGIMGCSDLLQETELSEEQMSYLRMLSDSSASLVTIINDLTDFARLDADKLPLVTHSFNLRQGLETVYQYHNSIAATKDLELTLEVDDNVPDMLLGDLTRLQQLLNNLIGNAIKFTRKGGVCARISVTEYEHRNVVLRFEVIDTGIGIPEKHTSNIFDSFVQVDGSTTREFGGLGLGLAICTRLVTAMKGEIGLSSVEGKGSTFWFQVPFETAQENKNEAII